MQYPFYIQIAAQLFSILVGVISYRKKSVSVSGLTALLLISSLFIWTKEVGLLFSLFYMFASSSLLTKFQKHRKKEFDIVVGKTGPRDYIQALSNLGVATGTLLFYLAIPHESLVAAILGSIAAANADSWASEIGGLSKSTPRMITNFKPTVKGVSGGVTWLGTIGGIGGSLFIVLTGIYTMQLLTPFNGNLQVLAWTAFFSGVIGFLFDSYLGAISQALYQHKTSGQLSEQDTPHSELRKGIRWMNNDLVNFITTLVGAVVAGGGYLVFA